MAESTLATCTSQMRALLNSASLKRDVFIAKFMSIVTNVTTLELTSVEAEFALIHKDLSQLEATKDTSLHLWYLSHPSFPIFWAFVHDTEMLNHFAMLLWFARPHHNGGKRALKRRLLANIDPLRDFAKRYTLLIREHYHSKIDYITGIKMYGHNRTRCIELLSLSQFSDEDHTIRAQKRWEEFTESLVANFAQKTNQEMRMHGEDLYRLSKRLIGEKIDKLVLDEADWLPLLERDRGEAVFSYLPVRNDLLSTGGSLEQKIYSSMRVGLWPRFKEGNIHQRITLSAEYPRISEAVHQSLKDALTVKYREFMEYSATYRRCHHQLLSIGLKVHYTKMIPLGIMFNSFFHLTSSEGAIVLPPVGNMSAAKELLGQLAAFYETPIIGNPQMYQIQVCTPGRLNREHCAMLGSAFYLGSDVIRDFTSVSLSTTHDAQTGKRLIIYDAGILDTNFDWNPNFPLASTKILSTEPKGRTDVLCCESWQDIENVNLVASLLVHLEHQGTLAPIASEFAYEFRGILKQYNLDHTQCVPWVTSSELNDQSSKSHSFDSAFASMQAIALADAKEQTGKKRQKGLLYDVQQLLWYTRTLVQGGN